MALGFRVKKLQLSYHNGCVYIYIEGLGALGFLGSSNFN